MNILQAVQKLAQLLDNSYVALSTQVLAVTGASTALTVPAGACFAVIQTQGDDIRYWESTAPTGTQGILLEDKSVVIINNESNLSTVRFILASGSAAANLHIQYYKRTW